MIDKKNLVKGLKSRLPSDDPKKIFEELKSLSDFSDQADLQMSYGALFQLVDRKSLGLKNVKIAILANHTAPYLADVLEFYMAMEGFSVEIFQSDYGTLEQSVLDPGSAFYAFKPNITFLFTNYRDVQCPVNQGASQEEVMKATEQAVGKFVALWDAIRKNSKSHIVQNNADLPLIRVFGNYEGSVAWSQMNFLRRFNLELAGSLAQGVTIFDLEYISAVYGKARWQDMRFWYHAKQPFGFDALGLVAHEMSKVVSSIKGAAKKCIVLDLDNTLWGGVIADDGLNGIALGHGAQGEAFVDFQKYLSALKSRGIILAVSTKNFDDIAKEPFLRHSDMQLKLDDIAVFEANWDNKAASIRKIAAQLNIGLDAIVFLDDNPAERLLVRQMLPEVSVPDLPQDPSCFVPFLSQQSYFETVQFSYEDQQRGQYYLGNAQREGLRKVFENLDEYLESLEMEGVVGDLDEQHMARVIQLINKTNQFNLTTIRYTENELKARMASSRVNCRYYKLKDRFGDNGLIAVVILEVVESKLVIDTWLMSCRVLSRGMEEFICKDIISIAQAKGCVEVLGNYKPTNKNKLVEDLFGRLGFQKIKENDTATSWALSLTGTLPEYRAYIKRCELSPN